MQHWLRLRAVPEEMKGDRNVCIAEIQNAKVETTVKNVEAPTMLARIQEKKRKEKKRKRRRAHPLSLEVYGKRSKLGHRVA